MSSSNLPEFSNVGVAITVRQSPMGVEVRIRISCCHYLMISNVQARPSPLAIPHTNEEFRKLLMEFFEGFGVPHSPISPCLNFYNACYEDMARRSWSAQTIKDVQPYFPVGAIMSLTAYNHLESLQAKVLIANYTTLLTYVDDKYE